MLNALLTVLSVKLPKSFVAINLSEKVPEAFSDGATNSRSEDKANDEAFPSDEQSVTPPGNLEG